MLPKEYRLNLKFSFKWVASGERFETPYTVLFVNRGNNEHALVGISLSSKVFRKSHERNRARRLVSNAFQDLIHEIKPGLNIVVLPKRRIVEVKSTEVLRVLKDFFDKQEFIVPRK